MLQLLFEINERLSSEIQKTMDSRNDELKERIGRIADVKLLEMIKYDRSEYTAEALAAAESEIERRGGLAAVEETVEAWRQDVGEPTREEITVEKEKREKRDRQLVSYAAGFGAASVSALTLLISLGNGVNLGYRYFTVAFLGALIFGSLTKVLLFCYRNISRR